MSAIAVDQGFLLMCYKPKQANGLAGKIARGSDAFH